jgi:TPR repeat protein
LNFFRESPSGRIAADAFLDLAELAFNRGDRDLAFKYYDRSIEMGYLESFYRKARLMEIMGSYPQALALPLSYLYHHHLAPPALRPRALAGAEVSGGHLRAQLPPLSWNVLRLGRSG